MIASSKQKRHIRRDAAPGPTPLSPVSRPRTLLIALVLFLLAVVPYLQTVHYGFVNLDDGLYVSENPLVQRGLTWANVSWALTTSTASNWHPLTWLSHMLDCQLFGLQPGWHHLVNVLLHGLDAALVFLVLHAATGAVWRSALVAALFALHPLHVESVAWIAERKDVLSTLFGLCALRAYVRYAQAPSWPRFGLVALLFASSLLAKPMWVTFPFLLLLLDIWPLGRWPIAARPPRMLLLEKLPLLALSALSCWLTIRAQSSADAMAAIDLHPLTNRIGNAVAAYAAYLGKAFWPANLAVIYPLPERLSTAEIALAALVLAAITVVAVRFRRQRPWLLVGWLWFLGMLVPVIGLVQVGSQALADRYTYVPLIGVFVMLVWSVPAAASPARQRLTAAIVALVLATLGGLTFIQVQYWQNTKTLFEHAVRVTDGNYMAHNLLAGALAQQGDVAAARRHVDEALRIRPNYAGAHYNLGVLLVQQSNFAAAANHFQRATETSPHDATIWNGLGVANLNLKKFDDAILHFKRALELSPHLVSAYANLGAAYLAQNNAPAAIEACERALELQPDLADAHATLAAALWTTGRRAESIVHNRRAVELAPNLLAARMNLALSLLTQGDTDGAIVQLEEVLRRNPNHETAKKALAAARQRPRPK